MSDTAGDRQHCCCISHEFFRAASQNPNKVAVIHASGGARIIRQLRNPITSDSHFNGDIANKFINELPQSSSPSPSLSPPVYPGDQCFTFSDLLESVESLSSRLRCILDGGDDPYLIKPRDDIRVAQLVDDQISTSSMFVKPSTDVMNMYTPKILGIYMVPSAEYIIAVLSVLRCGEAFVPLDPSWPAERILSIVSSSHVDLIIGCRSSLFDKSHGLVDCTSCSILYISMKENLQEHIGPSHLVWPCEKGKLRLFCYLMYTSGSTGNPKGVCGTEQGLLNRFLWMQEMYPLLGEEILLFKTSISFIDHLQEFLGAVLTSSTLVVPPSNELKENLFYLIDFLQAYTINRLVAVPTLIRAILPGLLGQENMRVWSSLKLLVLSGEVLPLSLWENLSIILPETSILNLYGSTEVSGDCTYFDCKRLPMILKTQTLSSVPIGIPISNCDIVLVGENDTPNQGEIYVGGSCVSIGYFSNPAIMSSEYVKLPDGSTYNCSTSEDGSQYYFRTGDFAMRLQSGDLVFLGRKDRTMKVNGQRIALEEIENTLRGHPDVVDAAVISHRGPDELVLLAAFLVLTHKSESAEILRSSIRNSIVRRLTLAMIPNHFFFTESLPMTSSGKVDYALLAGSTLFAKRVQNEITDIWSSDLLQVIKKAFCDALMVDEISNDDNFFTMGGNSIAAAHVSHNLGIDMRLLYMFPSPSRLHMALLDREGSFNIDVSIDSNSEVKPEEENGNIHGFFNFGMPETIHEENYGYPVFSKCLNVDSNIYANSGSVSSRDGHLWSSILVPMSCSYSRCNKVMHEGEYVLNGVCLAARSEEVSRNRRGFMREVWKVHMESCVDASPIVVFKDQDIYLFIGSHSHKFFCVDVKCGFVHWEIKLEGRIECSAAILGDFSQVVVGCYNGIIYFLDSMNGNICWTFQTYGEYYSYLGSSPHKTAKDIQS